MSKHNFFVKILKKINLLINSLLEKNLNKLNFILDKKKISSFNSFKRTFAFLFVLLIFTFSYLSLPNLYNSNKLIDNIKNQLSKNLNIDFNLSNNFSYKLFPKPNFTFESVSFFNEVENIGEMLVYISIKELFFPNKIKIKDVILKKVNFNFNKDNYNFFAELLKNDFSNFNFKVMNSNIFYRNIENDVLFINKIKYLKYYYDPKSLENILFIKNEIFNIPYDIQFKNNDIEKIASSIINFNSLDIKIENDLTYKKFEKEGLIKLSYGKKKSEGIYSFSQNLFKFNLYDKSVDQNFTYEGIINKKPFFSEISVNFKEINLDLLLNPNLILVQFLKTEILNNKNLNIGMLVKAKQISFFKDLINLGLKINISGGLIDINETSFNWLNYVEFEISDSLLHLKNNNLILDAIISVKIKDHNKVYKFFQTPLKYRKKIKKIEFNINYNFDQLTLNLNDIKVDGSIDVNVNKTLNQLILKDTKLQNRIYFKNLINKAIKFYSG